MFICIFRKEGPAVEFKEFADHPVGIGAYPEYDGHIVANLTHELPGADRDHDRNKECGKDHGNTQRFPDHTPADVFE